MTLEFLTLLFWLLVGHALADFPLQGPFLSAAKNRHTPEGKRFCWPWAMSAHALIQGGAVALATGSVLLGLCETLAHALIDILKCEGWLTAGEDQLAHLACKVMWAAIVVAL